ncbi:nitrous oxide-stimulated promoter family protein [Anaeromicropila herbilytica]|uniref:Nitrous oxide-stimulated promoter family protein n=1 Tax=Anaeromicropila herbilytica TaxID=2785025 RepID=A0A7R7EIY5_9FIRM|nr:nitrous oxide-stimulated promoter family protein [Anaeromicropila herbilytica]BCN29579.1 hypothetical protein bsdtb5_08740 [Anaeromicropila herbilytica]
MSEVSKKQKKELNIIRRMIELYCHGHKHSEKGLCKDCLVLLEYANQRILSCPISISKTYCSSCKIHCYKTEMRDRIRTVMKYSGPRMMVHNPILTLEHAIVTIKTKCSKK